MRSPLTDKQQVIWNVLDREGPMSAAQLREITGRNKATLEHYLNVMMINGHSVRLSKGIYCTSRMYEVIQQARRRS